MHLRLRDFLSIQSLRKTRNYVTRQNNQEKFEWPDWLTIKVRRGHKVRRALRARKVHRDHKDQALGCRCMLREDLQGQRKVSRRGLTHRCRFR